MTNFLIVIDDLIQIILEDTCELGYDQIFNCYRWFNSNDSCGDMWVGVF